MTQEGDNTWKLGELLLLAGSGKFASLLLGFPSYAALVGSLGVAGVGSDEFIQEQHYRIRTI